jgi:hypothetical protein
MTNLANPVDITRLFDFTRLRLLAKVRFGRGCWRWQGAQRSGYGAVTYRARQWPAHRLLYEWMVGPIPRRLDLDHLCRQPLCVRPDHLEPVSRRENLLRGNTVVASKVRQTHCIHGHPLSGGNLYSWRTSRKCKTCHRDNEYRRRVRRRLG